MKKNREEKELFISAAKRVKRIKNFYLHLILYFIGVALISYNFYIMEGPYVSVITGLNISTLVLWTVIIIIHAWSVFKGKLLFKRSWENKKIKKYLDENNDVETTFWE